MNFGFSLNRKLNDLHIQSDYIAVFGSGNSLLDLTDVEFNAIKQQCFTITCNYGPLRYQPHLNVWSDTKVSEFWEMYYQSNPKDCLLLVKENIVPNSMEDMVDFTFHQGKDGLKGNFTLVWILQLLQRCFPNKTILLFGVDMYAAKGNQQAKWYDTVTNYDKENRGEQFDVDAKLLECARQLQVACSTHNVFNCNPNSQLDLFTKKSFEEVVDYAFA